MIQTITRKGSFDVCHRVMNEKMKCFHVHGHTYLYELGFSFSQIETIGYNIDFKEIKRCQILRSNPQATNESIIPMIPQTQNGRKVTAATASHRAM